MAQRLAELCSLLVETTFGDLAAQIFSTLAEYGRLSLVSLRQYSEIPPRRLKAGLTTLIQHHVVLYHAGDEDEPTYFQVDWHAAYMLVRTQKLLKFIKDREGETAAQVVANILQLGHTSVGDLAAEYDLASGSKRDSGIDTVEDHMTEDGMVNGIAKKGKQYPVHDKSSQASKFHATLRRLLRNGFLLKVNKRAFIPTSDLQEQIKEMVITDHFPDRKITGTKKQLLYQHAVNKLKRKWEDENSYSQTHDIGSHGEIKRPTTVSSSNKRIKSNDIPNGVDHRPYEDECEEFGNVVEKLPNDLVLCVNFNKCALLLRNQRLERMADRFLGPVTAAVYGALLSSLEPKSKAARDTLKIQDDDDEDGEPLLAATDAEVYEHLDKSIDLASTIKGAASASKLSNGVGSHRKKPQYIVDDDDLAQLGIKQEEHSASEDEHEVDSVMSVKERKKRTNLIDMHLQILGEHPKRFCIRHSSEAKSQVDFALLTKTLMQAELDTIINARLGTVSLRMIRMLRDRGKLDEKQIASMSMMRIKEARAKLTELQFHGLAELQELPKDNGRQPSRTVYLWWFDEERVCERFLQETYQGLARTLQRLRFEREVTYRAAIEKAERTDVKGREQELLNHQDKETLRQWREVEEQLLVQVGRLDEVVAMLRDIRGTDTSLTT